MNTKDLKHYRERVNLPQIDLAIKSGIKHGANISGMESYKFHLTEKAAAKMAPMLGVKADELFINHNFAAMKHKIAKCGSNIQQISRVLLETAENEQAPKQLRKVALDGLRAIVKAQKSTDTGQKGLKNRDMMGRKAVKKKDLSRNIITGMRY